MYQKRGLLISFEGIENCGKGTQIHDFLVPDLRRKGIPVSVYREPGGTTDGEIERLLLKRPGIVVDALNYYHHEKSIPDFTPLSQIGERSAQTEFLRFLISRSALIDLTIQELQKGKNVIYDRYIDSSVAYQGYGLGMGEENLISKIKLLNLLATRETIPDLTFLIEISYDEMLRRQRGNPDSIEKRGKEFFKRVIEGYSILAEEQKDRINVLNGERSPEVIHQDVVKIVEEELRKKGILT